jgi:hypothetical protein
VGNKKSPEKSGDVVGFNFNSTIETSLASSQRATLVPLQGTPKEKELGDY